MTGLLIARHGGGKHRAAALLSYHDTIMADSPVAYYRLNETSGTSAADASGHTNTGTYTGGYTLGQTTTATDGDKAVLLNGTTGYITIPNSASLQLGDVFSIEAWIKLPSAPISGTETIIGQGSGSTGGPGLRLISNEVRLMYSDQSALASTFSTGINDTGWHHLVGTKNGATIKVYIDAVDKTTSTTNHTMANSPNAVTIGNRASADWFSGTVDEVAIYATALSSTRVAAHYAAR